VLAGLTALGAAPWAGFVVVSVKRWGLWVRVERGGRGGGVGGRGHEYSLSSAAGG
jgi:hypothetical protein